MKYVGLSSMILSIVGVAVNLSLPFQSEFTAIQTSSELLIAVNSDWNRSDSFAAAMMCNGQSIIFMCWMQAVEVEGMETG